MFISGKIAIAVSILTIAGYAWPVWAKVITSSPLSLKENEFVSVKENHLSYMDRPIRLWGVNFVCNVKQRLQDIPLSFDRITDAGFNAVRLNLFSGTFLGDYEKNRQNSFTVPVTVKGSDSAMDRLDYSVALAKERGMFFWFTFNLEKKFLPADYDVLPDDGSRDRWNELIKTKPATLVYLDERAERVHQEYAKAILEHVNPYTGKRYADEETIALYEIFNENHFVEELISTGFREGILGETVRRRWNDWLIKRYETTEKLTQAWGSLNAGERLETGSVEYAPLLGGIETENAGYQREFIAKNSQAEKYPYARGEDVVRFACDLYISHTQRFIRFVRSLGRGIAIVPITPTGRFGQSLPTYYAASCGDFVSNGLYGFACRTWSIDKNDPLYPFLSRVNESPMMEQPIDITRVAGKPYLYYEVNDYRPNPYTTEFPMRVALLASWQDVDGVFWFNWDATGYLPPLKSDSDYVRSRLPMPDTNYPNAALLLANDEVALAAIKSAGVMYLNRLIPPAEKPTTIVIGGDSIFNLSRSLEDIAAPIRYYAWRQGTQLVYQPEGKTKTLLPKKPKDAAAAKMLKMGPYVTFNWQKDHQGYIEVVSPALRARVGFNGETIHIGDTKIENVRQPFTSIVFVSEDGLPLEESARVLVTMAAKNTNTGFVLDPSKMKSRWAKGLAEAVVKPGSAPPIVDRVFGSVSAPWLKGMSYEKFDFSRQRFSQGRVDEVFTVGSDEPMFYGRLLRPVVRPEPAPADKILKDKISGKTKAEK